MKLRARLVSLDGNTDRRGASRQVLRLDVALKVGDTGVKALVHDLSRTGLMFETEGKLAVGDELLLELPDRQMIEARIVWNDKTTYGCEFLAPISNSLIGAIVLRAPFDMPVPQPTFRVEEVVLGPAVGVDFLAQWYADFEERRASSGEQLIGFRLEKGQIIALISRLN